MAIFDQILADHLKMGPFQKRTLLVVSLIDFSDGVEKTIIGILLTILAHEWNLQQSEVSNLASIYFMGIVSGTLYCSFNADSIGRQRTLMVSSLIGFVCMLWMSLAQTYLEMFLLRLGFGFIFGTTIPLGHVVITEIIPANIRGSVMTFVATVFIVGKVYCTFLCMGLLSGFDAGHWRILVALNSLPLLLCCIGSVIYLRESPRYYLTRNQFSEAFEEIEMIAVTNNVEFQLTDSLKEGMIDDVAKITVSETKVAQLFQGKYEGFTLRMWVVFILTSFIECSLYILMPFWLHEQSKGFEIILFMMISELLANVFVYRIIDSKIFGGRQKLIIYIALIIAVLSFLTYIFREPLLIIGMTTISFFLKMMFTTEMVIMNENYTTQYRSMGVGLTQTVGKFTGAVIPFIVFPIFYYDPFLPFLLYFICMIIQAIFAYQFPFDMTQVELDCVRVFA